MADKEGLWMKRIKFTAWAIGTLLVVWGAATNHFALADDLEATQEELRIQKMSTEESMLLMQIDVNEERIERAEKKKGQDRDQSKIDRLKRKLSRMETRLNVLEKIRLAKEAGVNQNGR